MRPLMFRFGIFSIILGLLFLFTISFTPFGAFFSFVGLTVGTILALVGGFTERRGEKCPFYSIRTSKNARICPHCSKEIFPLEVKRICPFCGQAISTEATSCPHCRLPSINPTPKECPFYHEAIREGTLLCPHCGNKLDLMPKER